MYIGGWGEKGRERESIILNVTLTLVQEEVTSEEQAA